MPFTLPETIYIGTYANDGTGDDLRTAFAKVNRNFTLINNELGVTGAANVDAAGEGIFVSKTDNTLNFKRIVGSGGVTVTSNPTQITIAGLSSIQGDNSPSLGNDLNLNGHNILGTGQNGYTGDVQSTVWGLDVRTINAQVQSLVGNDIDFGSFTSTVGTLSVDFGTF